MMSAFQLGRISLKAQPRLPLLHLFDGVSDLCGHEGYRITEEPFSLHSGEGAAVTHRSKVRVLFITLVWATAPSGGQSILT